MKLVVSRRQTDTDIIGWDWPDNVHPVLRRIYAARRISSIDELDLSLAQLTPVGSWAELSAAVDLLIQHRDGRIVIFGDFDSDGATSVAMMVLGLRRLGFSHVDYFIPDRFKLGYGLTPDAVERVADLDAELIVTVDNGISSGDGVAAARAAGIDVLVTDHHLPPEQLPSANVIVNPNISTCDFPGKNLAGVGVAFYLLAAVGRVLEQPAVVAEYLDLVALGTVADLVTLDRQNRILVNQGLARIRAGRCRPGILALCTVARADYHNVNAATLGFQIGPRLNAAGRLDDMRIGVRCLLAEDNATAMKFAEQLDQLNRSRRDIEARMRDEAYEIVNQIDLEASAKSANVVCMHHADWHEGLVGLVASRVKDLVGLPTFAFAPADSGMKGSGRSIDGFHLRDALAEVDALYPHLISRFGGHAMAAGLTLAAENFADFVSAIDAVGKKYLSDEQRKKIVLTDGEVEPIDLGLPLAETLTRAGPWGQGFPEPVFDGEFFVAQWRWLKEVHLKLSLRPRTSGACIEAIAFNCAFTEIESIERVRILYRLDVNDFNGTRRPQLIVEHIEAAH